MNGQLEALWLELFGQKITPIEASLLTAVERKVDSDSPILMLASVMVRMLYLVLVERRDSPFGRSRLSGARWKNTDTASSRSVKPTAFSN